MTSTTTLAGRQAPPRRRHHSGPSSRPGTSRPPTGAPPVLAPWVGTHRRLVLIDIENIVGGSGATADDVRRALDALLATIGVDEHDVVRYACGPTLLVTAMTVLPRNMLMGRGIDGADQRLLEHMSPQQIVGRYASVVLASADSQAFCGAVALLAEAGVPTDLFIGAGHLGHALARVARSITEIRAPRHCAA